MYPEFDLQIINNFYKFSVDGTQLNLIRDKSPYLTSKKDAWT